MHKTQVVTCHIFKFKIVIIIIDIFIYYDEETFNNKFQKMKAKQRTRYSP